MQFTQLSSFASTKKTINEPYNITEAIYNIKIKKTVTNVL